MADVFISYKREDRAWAERVDIALRDAGYSTWWDTSLVAGEHFNEAIDRELKAAKCVVVLWSESAARSRWVNAEAVSGFERDVLVSCRLDDVVLTYPFSVVQTADMRVTGVVDVVAGVANRTSSRVAHHPPRRPKPTLHAALDDLLQPFGEAVARERKKPLGARLMMLPVALAPIGLAYALGPQLSAQLLPLVIIVSIFWVFLLRPKARFRVGNAMLDPSEVSRRLYDISRATGASIDTVIDEARALLAGYGIDAHFKGGQLKSINTRLADNVLGFLVLLVIFLSLQAAIFLQSNSAAPRSAPSEFATP